jgi:N-acetylmuramoyl-L-alanine amidase
MRVLAMATALLGLTATARADRYSLGGGDAARFIVVVDAGHGGSNTGAPSRAPGVYEKRVTLAVARALDDELRARGFTVVLTRRRDEYVTLRQRARRANAVRPDCFISLHTNASGDGSRHGVETWVLAREAADVEARRAASRERDDVQALLVELARLDEHRASAVLAQAIQSSLAAALGAVDRGVRQGGYDVLAGVTAPAVLVELGFLDHPIEGAALLEPAQQRRIAAALAAGIASFAEGVRGAQKLVMSTPHATGRTATR